jgi:hypothetical protein
MGEDFYSVIKLISGEEIFSLISVDENDGDPIIILQNPAVIKVSEITGGTMIKIRPWMTLTDDDMFIIRLDKIITMTECKDKRMIEIYNNYLTEDSMDAYNLKGEVKVSSDMGYISSVEESRKKLEILYNNIKES